MDKFMTTTSTQCKPHGYHGLTKSKLLTQNMMVSSKTLLFQQLRQSDKVIWLISTQSSRKVLWWLVSLVLVKLLLSKIILHQLTKKPQLPLQSTSTRSLTPKHSRQCLLVRWHQEQVSFLGPHPGNSSSSSWMTLTCQKLMFMALNHQSV